MVKYKIYETYSGVVHVTEYHENPQSEKGFNGYTGYIESVCGHEITNPSEMWIVEECDIEIKGGKLYHNKERIGDTLSLCRDCKNYLE
jgi:hypothetical protein